ncbi:MAG: ribosomal protein S18-alanine N-acetyltransferase [Halobacteria archaeon]|nr:ribosomal protein S18-alanine N-acetyltransferase [Halobacteria archaeon]
MTVPVRTARPHDIDDLIRLEHDCFESPNPRLLIRLCGSSDGLLVYETDGDDDVVGYILAVPVGRRDARVLSFCVDESNRREGYGRTLMLEAVRRLRDKGFERLSLEVRVSNSPAIELYESFGFVRTGRQDGYYEDGEDAYVMEKSL